MTIEQDAIAIEAKAAWDRIRTREKASFDDWLVIGRALIMARQQSMAAAGVNKPFGPAYQRRMRAWLDENGLGDVDSHERTNAIHLVEHRAAIESWRAGLSDMERRRANHPNTIMAHWRRNTRPQRQGPKRRTSRPMVRTTSSRPVHWPQDCVRRAADAMRECGGRDLYRLARVALEAAIRSEADLWALVETSPTPGRTGSGGEVRLLI